LSTKDLGLNATFLQGEYLENQQPLTSANDGYVITYVDSLKELKLLPSSGGGGAPTGPAGGGLSGTYPNPSLQLNAGGTNVLGTLPAGNLPSASGSGLGVIELANDLGGTAALPAVVGIRSISVPTPSGTNTVLTYNSGAYTWSTSSGGGITAITGDLSASGSGSVVGTLATVNSSVGSYGSSTQVPTFTVNGKGLITAASNTAIAAPSITGITGDAGFTGTTASGTITLDTVNSNVGSYGGATAVPIITVNAKGLITAVSTTTPTVSAVSGITISGTPTSGQLLTATSSSAANWQNAPTSGINQLTGDGTAGPGSGSQALTLATVNSNVGSFGSTTQIPTFTVNGKGLITAASNVSLASSGLPTITLTGDITGAASGGSVATTLATVNSNVGSFGSSTQVGTFTVNAKGLITAASNTAIAAPSITGITGDVSHTGTTASGTATLATVNSNVGTYGDSTHVAQITVNGKGLITAVSNVAVSGGGGGGGGLTAPVTATVGTKATNYTLTTSDYVIFADTSGGAFTITLPSPSTAGQMYIIKDSTGSFETNNLTIARHASENIEGVAASRICSTNWGVYRIISNGTNWFLGV
jgi:hypothetical protein